METSEIIARANEAVQEIYEKMGRIESCEKALKALDGAEVYIGKSKTDIFDLHAALSDEQIAGIMTSIHTVIRTQIDKAADELNMICKKDEMRQSGSGHQGTLESLTLELFGSKAAKELKDKAAVQNAAADVKVCTEQTTPNPEKDSGKESMQNVKTDKKAFTSDEEKLLRKLYVDESKTVKEIAEIMGLTKSTVYSRIHKYGLRNKRYDGEWDGYAAHSAGRN